MPATHADVTDGARVNIFIEFVSRRSVDIAGDSVERLVVKDRDGTQFPVFFAPERTEVMGLKTGVTYRIDGLIGADPDLADAITVNECPECGSYLRNGQAIDTIGVSSPELIEGFQVRDTVGIADSNTTFHSVREDGDFVDDWVPMEDHDPVPTPEAVCDECGARPALHRTHGDSSDQLLECNASFDASPMEMNAAAPETVGLAAGGAKDVTNFRENIANGYTPQPEAISDEGLFYDYYFETGDGADSDALFAPRYASAATDHPVTSETEQYLSVGLDSTLSVEDFERPRLDLVAVLDVSGSMDSPFDAYYYDEHGRRREAECDATTKLDAAIQSLCALTEQLRDDDRLGVVLYNHRAHVAKPLRDVATTDMPAIRRHIQDIAAGGGTNLADGFEAAVDMLDAPESSAGVERRVVFMTDMMPNTGTTGESELTNLFANAAGRGVHTTFIGMGIDTNAELVDTLSGIRGANHYFVHSADEFEQRLGEEFDYMVTPLVYDLDLRLNADGYEIAAVHGSPSADDATDSLMHVGTLFPSAKQDGEARGGVVLVRLEELDVDGDAELVASWTERDGGEYTERVSVEIPDSGEVFDHDGIRKAVCLARYARGLRAWAQDIHERDAGATGVDDWLLPDARDRHERESVPLVVPEEYAERFDQLRQYLTAELEVLGDDTLEQEEKLLATLSQEAPNAQREVTE